MGSIFQFKQFSVDQADCAMKINTDGVLLGATADHPTPNRILDVGTGTGVIAMMLAQRYEEAIIDAIEIDPKAATRAHQNFLQSPFVERLQAWTGSFEDFSTSEKYDLIVSNPPFYTNSLHNPDKRKKIARHTDDEFFRKLIFFSAQRLKDHGLLQLILPCDLAIKVVGVAEGNNLFLEKKIYIKSYADTEAFRCIISLSRKENNVDRSTFVIYKERSIYTTAYNKLLQNFFLKL